MREELLSFDGKLKTPIYFKSGASSQSSSELSAQAVLLHGYGQTGEEILTQLAPVLPLSWNLLAPTAPYPFYNYKEKKMVASWYFFDPSTQRYVVDKSLALQMLHRAFEVYLEPGRPLYIIGYSQGGYMAPFAGLLSADTKKVVVLNGRLRDEELRTEKPHYSVLSLHGAADDKVEVPRCKKSAEALEKVGWTIDFRQIEAVGHRLEPVLLKELKGLLND